VAQVNRFSSTPGTILGLRKTLGFALLLPVLQLFIEDDAEFVVQRDTLKVVLRRLVRKTLRPSSFSGKCFRQGSREQWPARVGRRIGLSRQSRL
jgi:hypothetical protein